MNKIHDSLFQTTAGAVRQYSLLYRTPPDDPADAPMLGNGVLGAIVWCDKSRLFCRLNRSDLWRDGATGNIFHNWAVEEEESSTALLHGGTLVLDFNLPVFERVYLHKAEWIMDISTGVLTAHTESVFGTVDFKFFAAEQTDGIHWELEYNLAEETEIKLTLEHYGSRTFPHWYSRVLDTPEAGLDCGRASRDGDILRFTGRVSDGFFGLAAQASVKAERFTVHRYTAAAEYKACAKRSFTVHALCSAPEYPDESTASKTLSERLVHHASNLNTDRENTLKYWRNFWQESFIDCGEDYFNALWHLHLFYTAASQRGRYPARFIGALWNFHHDFQAWNFYFHWNQQMTYWPLCTAGHSELCTTYLNWRFSGLEHARDAARTIFHSAGGWVSDVSDRNNNSSAAESGNHTIMAQIALEMYKYFRYTGDTAFLREKVYPYMTAAAEFLASGAELRPDGKYHLAEATSYEGWIKLRDCATEQNTIRALSRALTEAEQIIGINTDFAGKLKEIADNLAEPVYLKDLDVFSDGKGNCGIGIFKGTPWRGNERLSAGFSIQDNKHVSSITGLRKKTADSSLPDRVGSAMELERSLANFAPPPEYSGYDGIFPISELSCLYPAGPLSLNDKGTEMFNAAVNTALIGSISGGIIAWDPTAIMLARLGLGRELFEYLLRFAGRWQNFINGHFVDSLMSREVIFGRAVNPIKTVERGGKEESGKRNFAVHEFRHLGTEGLSVTATALTEAMLQDCSGIIRLFAGIPSGRSARFLLTAPGGTRIAAEKGTEKVLWIALKFGWNGELKLANPWKKARISGTAASGEILVLHGTPGDILFLSDADQPEPENMLLEREEKMPEVRISGFAQLGMEQVF